MHEPDPLDTARLDQHLLSSPAAVRTLVDTAGLNGQDIVADLGAGTGVITRELIDRRPKRIYVIELDARFGPVLERLTDGCRNVELIWGDILDTWLPDLTKVVASPPFGITERLVGWLHRLPALVSASLVMGRSFGVSATAEPGSRHYNRLSLGVQARFAVNVVASLAPTDFCPPSRTPACVVRLVPNRRAASIDASVDRAFTHRGGMKVKDLLWQLRTHDSALGPPATRRMVVGALRRSEPVQDIYQLRLQNVSSADLSRFMAELHRLTARET